MQCIQWCSNSSFCLGPSNLIYVLVTNTCVCFSFLVIHMFENFVLWNVKVYHDHKTPSKDPNSVMYISPQSVSLKYMLIISSHLCFNLQVAIRFSNQNYEHILFHMHAVHLNHPDLNRSEPWGYLSLLVLLQFFLSVPDT